MVRVRTREQGAFKSRGFTLIETAISLMVLGIIVTFLIPIYNQYHRNKIETQTEANLQAARTALENFKSEHGRYPCPSPLSANRGDSDYGHETDCTDSSVSAGNCEAGMKYCVQDSPRVTVPALTSAQKRVRIGALPFRQIRMAERQSYDGWDSKILYVVAESLTGATTYNDGRGNIRITDENNESIGNAAYQDSYKFLVFSPGSNRVGGFTMDGQNTAPCNASYAAKDKDNCDFLGGESVASFSFARQSTSLDNNYFDDKIIYTAADVTGNSEGWRFGQDSLGENTSDIMIEGRNVRIGNFDVPNDPLSVFGNLKLDSTVDGKFLVDQYCGTGGANCFDVAGLTYTCPPGEYVVGLGSGLPHIKCLPVSFGCDGTGKILGGINISTGLPVCVTTSVPPTTPPVGGPGPVTPPICVPASTSVSLPCPADPGTFYDEVTTRACPSGTTVTTSNQSTKCCNKSQNGTYRCYVGSSYNTLTANAQWPQTRATCSDPWSPATHPSPPTCVCQPDSYADEEPTICNSAYQNGDQCKRNSLVYGKDADGKCINPVATEVSPGTCKAALFYWDPQSPTPTINPSNSGPIPDEGDSCSYGDSPRTCERTTGSGYQVWSCVCKKKVEACTPMP